MVDKAYIVANKQQEIEVLKKLERKGFFWLVGINATDFVPSENSVFNKFVSFPYPIIEKEFIIWSTIEQLEDETIVYDGRKEEKMYKVTQEFMNELITWRDDEDLDATSGKNYNYVNDNDLDELPAMVEGWWVDNQHPIERNNRLIAIIQWLNGEDVFEAEGSNKFVVRSERTDIDFDYQYIMVEEGFTKLTYRSEYATKFDTREEAQEWANSHQVVVEIDEDGNEVE